jgi:hypothetical protein
VRPVAQQPETIMTLDQWKALPTLERATRVAKLREVGVDADRELRTPSGLLYAVPKRLSDGTLVITSFDRFQAILGWVVRDTHRRLPVWSFTHGQYIHHYRVVDLLGQTWYGQGSPGLSIRLNRTKNSPEPNL